MFSQNFLSESTWSWGFSDRVAMRYVHRLPVYQAILVIQIGLH